MQYDPFQKRAIEHINQGHSVIVAAPTGAGKTVIAEHVIETYLKQNSKVIYTAPIKALSNQKYRDFSALYPDKVGILTGDVTINAQAPTLIMTTEIFRNKIIEEHSNIADYAWVIFDELHYLDDMERGSVWEESLMFLPDHMKILGLSATIPNIRQLAKWIEDLHGRPVKVVIEHERPVPLHFYFQCENTLFEDLPRIQKTMRAVSKRVPRWQRYQKDSYAGVPNNPVTLIRHLNDQDLLPCIYFVFSRRRTEELARDLQDFNFLNSEESQTIKNTFSRLVDKYDIAHESSTYDIRPLIEKGIAYHHAGMLPTLKEVVEQLFTTRLIKVIFTTETFALGINMPARTVVFDDLRKIYADSFRPLKTRDFFQMAGRAGRRGIDDKGHVFCRVNPLMVSPEELERMLYGEPEQVVSRFNTSYATILHLYHRHQEKLYDVYPYSLHFYQQKSGNRRKAMNLLLAKVKLLKQLGHIRKNKITLKGAFAAQVYGYETLMGELFEQGILEKLSVTDLAVLAVSAVYEPRKGAGRPRLSKNAKHLQRVTNDIIFPILHAENSLKIKPYSKACHYHLATAMEGWIKGDSFPQILEKSSADEGEIVRYFRMAIQLLKEMTEGPLDDDLKSRAYAAIQKINRDVIDAEKQLRA